MTEERKGAVAQLLAVQLMRSPAALAQHDEVIEPMLKGMKASDFKPRYLTSVGGDLELAREGVRAIHRNQTKRLASMLSYAGKISNVLALMRWHVIRFDGPLLAYSDHPMVVWPLSVERTRAFRRQNLGPLGTLEIRIPIAPDVAILMNWIDRNDQVDLRGKRWVAAELNAFTISQAEREWMHRVGSEPEVAENIFSPLSRFIDPSYTRGVAHASDRRRHARNVFKRTQQRTWINTVEVLVDVTQSSRRAA
jgi:hypothetical protein